METWRGRAAGIETPTRPRRFARPGSRGSRARRFAVPLILAALLANCGTLPTLRLQRQLPLSQSTAVLSIEGPAGPVSPARAEQATEALAALGQGSVLDPYLAMSERLIGEPLVIGNRVALLVDGPATYDVMFQSLKKARSTIDIESYIVEEFRHAGGSFTDLLKAKHAEGVSIRVLADGVGSVASSADLKAITDAGIATCVFNPVETSWIWPARLNHRDHRKIVVVDGTEAFAGGINFSRVYKRASASVMRTKKEPTLDDGWRDTHVHVKGPGAGRLAELFQASWAKQDCPAVERPPPPSVIPKAGETVLQVVPSSPDDKRNLTYISALGAVSFARRSIAVTMAYFVPDDQLEEALMAAVKRGVRVELIVPGFSDFTGVFHAGRAHYTRLLEAGVQIYEQPKAFLHAKTVVVDDIWSAIGSTNWDWRSFVHNDEVTVVVIDEAFAGRMMALFRDDVAASEPLSLEEWRKRPLSDKFLEQFWSGFQWLL